MADYTKYLSIGTMALGGAYLAIIMYRAARNQLRPRDTSKESSLETFAKDMKELISPSKKD